jgi:hypothetical protein
VREKEMLRRRASRLRIELRAVSDPLARSMLTILAQALEDTAAGEASGPPVKLEGRSGKGAPGSCRRV